MGRTFLALPYYSQRTVFVSLRALLHWFRAMLCISAVSAVIRCPSVYLSAVHRVRGGNLTLSSFCLLNVAITVLYRDDEQSLSSINVVKCSSLGNLMLPRTIHRQSCRYFHANASIDSDNACDCTNEIVLCAAELCCSCHSVN